MDELTNPGEPEVMSEDTGTAETSPEVEQAEEVAPEESEAVVDLDDVEYEGKQYKLPKELKEALLRQSDYTKKTQEVAETRKRLEADRQEFQRVAQIQQQTIKEHAQLIALDQQLESYSKLDWNALIDQDPVQALKLKHQVNTLHEMRGQVASQIQQSQQQQLQMQQEAIAKHLESGRAQIAKEIKGWSPELAKSLADYGVNSGYSEQEMSGIVDPRAVKLLHKAYLYDQLIAKTAQQKTDVSPAPKPSAQLPSGKTPVQKDPGQMTDKEFAAWRRRQIAQRH